jgi:hypothetical protein
MSASPSDQLRYERALRRYFRIPAEERRSRDRERVLAALGIDNPPDFLAMHIPLWEAKVDELLDPASTDMLPISISHSYVNWVRGAIGTMPPEARVRIFSSKLKDTGLKKVILSLIHELSHDGARDFAVTEVSLLEKMHKDTVFSVRDTSGNAFTFYLSRFGCLGEYVYAGLPCLVGLPSIPVAYHLSPQGEEVLIKPKESGTNIYLDELPLAAILADGEWWVQGAARQDALGDCIGTALRYGHYVATPERHVVMIDSIELFHLEAADARIFEPIFEFLPKRAYPADAKKARAMRQEYEALYRDAYQSQTTLIRDEWGVVERYLMAMRRHIHTYTGELFETVLAGVRARVFGKK